LLLGVSLRFHGPLPCGRTLLRFRTNRGCHLTPWKDRNNSAAL
jgi:hypothetical protein